MASKFNIVIVLKTCRGKIRILNTKYYESPFENFRLVAYKRDFFRNMASKNSREALGVSNAFSYVDMGRVRGF